MLAFTSLGAPYADSTYAHDAAGTEYRTYEYDGQIRARWTEKGGASDYADFPSVPEAHAWLNEMAVTPTVTP